MSLQIETHRVTVAEYPEMGADTFLAAGGHTADVGHCRGPVEWASLHNSDHYTRLESDGADPPGMGLAAVLWLSVSAGGQSPAWEQLGSADRGVRSGARDALKAKDAAALIEEARDCATRSHIGNGTGPNVMCQEILAIARERGLTVAGMIGILDEGAVPASFEWLLLDWLMEMEAGQLDDGQGLSALSICLERIGEPALETRTRQAAYSLGLQVILVLRARYDELLTAQAASPETGAAISPRLEAIRTQVAAYVERLVQIAADANTPDDMIGELAPSFTYLEALKQSALDPAQAVIAATEAIAADNRRQAQTRLRFAQVLQMRYEIDKTAQIASLKAQIAAEEDAGSEGDDDE